MFDNQIEAEVELRAVDVDCDGSNFHADNVVDNSTSEVTADTATSNSLPFDEFELRSELKQAVADAGYKTPTPIQAEIIPQLLEGRDVLAQSQTGTGKTAAFALPILSQIDTSLREPQVLVLAPTRELAMQVSRAFETYGAHLQNLNVTAIYGGQDYGIQFRQLKRGVHAVIGTPGRIIDHLKRGTLDLSGIKWFVLDEADEMLNMGFLEDVQLILEHASEQRQVALFSATLPKPIREISKQYLNEPARITIKSETMTVAAIRQRALFVRPAEKVDALTRLLEVEDADGVIVFANTRDSTVAIAEKLNRAGLSAVALNGDMPQRVRERTIQQLKSGQLQILVATDVAARGLDVPRVSHVFNFDVPQNNEAYIHRIGRTGRAGRAGEAIIFLTNGERRKLRYIEQATRQPIEVVAVPTAEEINQRRVERFSKQIAETVQTCDLSTFERLTLKVADESNLPMQTIAAALAQMAQNGRDFFVKDKPKKKRSRDDRFEDTEQEPSRKRKGGKRSRTDRNDTGEIEAGMQRYRIQVGWADGAKPGNIVGAIANEGGIAGAEMGAISIQRNYSTIDLPEGISDEVLAVLHHTRVAGKQLRISVDGEHKGDHRSKKSNRNFSRNTKSYRDSSNGSKSRFKKRGSKPKNGKSRSVAVSSKRGKTR
ncbi:MAG: ATP-dependent RNA helicase [Planctomycetaceae bacterium]|nr:ATP-dependent RNA helicase [Planctomycetaceae bacterium]